MIIDRVNHHGFIGTRSIRNAATGGSRTPRVRETYGFQLSVQSQW